MIRDVRFGGRGKVSRFWADRTKEHLRKATGWKLKSLAQSRLGRADCVQRRGCLPRRSSICCQRCLVCAVDPAPTTIVGEVSCGKEWLRRESGASTRTNLRPRGHGLRRRLRAWPGACCWIWVTENLKKRGRGDSESSSSPTGPAPRSRSALRVRAEPTLALQFSVPPRVKAGKTGPGSWRK